jgi:hypothetical protein
MMIETATMIANRKIRIANQGMSRFSAIGPYFRGIRQKLDRPTLNSTA